MPSPSTIIHNWLKTATPDEARQLAKFANTSVAYLRHIAAGRRGMTADMAQRLAHASGGTLNQQDLCEACGRCPLVK